MPNRSYDHVVSQLLYPMAILPEFGALFAGIVARRILGGPHESVGELSAAAPILARTAPSSVAVLPVHGVIAPRMNLMSDVSGGTTFEGLTKDLRGAVADPSVGTIVLDVDSPGGSCAGANAFAAEVRKARAVKPVIAVAESRMCSAAYWLAANATEVVAAPDAHVGSIGVFTLHKDLSAYLAKEGVKLEYLHAGKYKVTGNETEPLTDDGRAQIQKLVNHSYHLMTRDIALGRGVPQDAVRAGYGEGGVLTADDALALGMIDRIATLDDTLTRLTGSANPLQLAAATSQELTAATDQERRWRHDVEQTFVGWQLHR
jgi:signal peptide peptidase SppA